MYFFKNLALNAVLEKSMHIYNQVNKLEKEPKKQ